MSPRKSRASFWMVGLACASFLLGASYVPVPYFYLKVGALLALLILFTAATFGFRYGKWVGLVTVVSLSILIMWPAKPKDPHALHAQYVSSLVKYIGTPYVWGGENGRGIDCSGLIRRAMVDALLTEGWKRQDPAALREAAFIWWSDCSAREMKNGYGGRIRTISAARRLNDVKSETLRLGDLAVMKSGVHVLAYIGHSTWIQADPNLANGGGKVIETRVPSRSGWFGQGVVICRWRSLS